MIKTKSGISLIVLVITILVLSILAATVIVSISNTNVIEETNKTVFKSDLRSYKEAFELYVTSETMKDNSFDRTTITTEDLETILGKVEEKYQDGLKVQDGKLVYDTEDETEKEIAKDLGMALPIINIPIGKETDENGKSKYIGYYVDTDDDGTVDGVIFADLAHSAKGVWNMYSDYDSENDEYITTPEEWSYNAISGTKDYYDTGKNYEGVFGTKPILKSVEGTNGEDRFYVMALDDLDKLEDLPSMVVWYVGSYEISDFSTITKKEFGEGKTNTNNMITVYNGAPRCNDTLCTVWAYIKEGWFLPSVAEWAAFRSAFSTAESEYSTAYSLKSVYHTSTLCSADSAYIYFMNEDFAQGWMTGTTKFANRFRLAATY